MASQPLAGFFMAENAAVLQVGKALLDLVEEPLIVIHHTGNGFCYQGCAIAPLLGSQPREFRPKIAGENHFHVSSVGSAPTGVNAILFMIGR